MERAQSELLSWPEAPGMSVMSVSHRESGGPYQRLMVRVEQLVREALDVLALPYSPGTYEASRARFLPG